jgi:hypothetical protein
MTYLTYDPTDLCVHCGGKIVGYAEVLNEIGKMCGAEIGTNGVCTPASIEEHIYGWRMRCFAAERFVSSLLAISMNQAAAETQRRAEHPQGLNKEWDGTNAEWKKINVRILTNAITRLNKIIDILEAGRDCTCGGCRDVLIDLETNEEVEKTTENLKQLRNE